VTGEKQEKIIESSDDDQPNGEASDWPAGRVEAALPSLGLTGTVEP